MCFGSLSCCVTQVRLSLRSQTNGRTFSFRIFWQRVEFMVPLITASHPGPGPGPDHHTTTTMFDCWYDVLFMKCCVGFTPDVTGHAPSKKFNFCLISPQNICPKVLGIIKIFFGKCEMSRSFWSAVAFALELSQGRCFFPVSYCWILNTDLTWGKWGLQFFRCCSGFLYELLDESPLHSWSNCGRPATPGKVHHFLSLWIMALTVVRWSPKALVVAL